MKKHVFIAVAILVSVLSASAQKARIQWTPKDKSGMGWYVQSISIGDNYSYRVADKKEPKLQKLDKEFKVIEEKPLPKIEYNGRDLGTDKETELTEVVNIGSKIYMLFSISNKELGTKENLACELKKDLSVGNAIILGKYNSTDKRNNSGIARSEGDSAFIYYQCTFVGDDERPKLKIISYTEDMRIRWEATQHLRYYDGAATITRAQVSNNGLFFLASVKYYRNPTKHFAFTQYKMIELPEPKKEEVEFEPMFVRLAANGQSIVTSAPYYNNAKDAENNPLFKITGVYVATFDLTQEKITAEKYQQLNSSVFNKFNQEGDYNVKNLWRVYYRVNDIAIAPNGNVGVMLDRVYYMYYTAMGTYTLTPDYNTHEQPTEKVIFDFSSNYEKKQYAVCPITVRGMNNPYYINKMHYLNGSLVTTYYNPDDKKHHLYAFVLSKSGSTENLMLINDPELEVMNWYFFELRIRENALIIGGASGYNRKLGILKVD